MIETIAKVIDYVASITPALVFVFSLIQFRINSERIKNEATIRAYNELQMEVFSPLNRLLKKYMTYKKGNWVLVPKELKKIDFHSDEWENFTNWLSKIETFSAGINTGIFSLEILKHVGGHYFVRLYHDLKVIIKRKEEMNISGGARYAEFKKVVDELSISSIKI
ncbi:MAG: DUF4760 domain-containing protein [Clostridia bacterium]|nr:DUF4760 domain-containing protein [Clostridia bacterium]